MSSGRSAYRRSCLGRFAPLRLAACPAFCQTPDSLAPLRLSGCTALIAYVQCMRSTQEVPCTRNCRELVLSDGYSRAQARRPGVSVARVNRSSLVGRIISGLLLLLLLFTRCLPPWETLV